MDILKEIIYEQNKEMLTRIANDKYNHDADADVCEKYLKSILCILRSSKGSNT